MSIALPDALKARTGLLRAGAAGVLSALLMLSGVAVAATPALADSAPQNPASPATPPTVAADALPTVQINGVVWSQVVVGNTVYAAGSFTRARPAGAAPGTQETVRNNLLAYDITTGNLITSFAPNLNAQALRVTASPDGSRIYVGGDFTQADGQPRYRMAAYSTATGALLNDFQPAFNGEVSAITATATTVYVGGIDWGSAGGATRNFLASFSASNGAVTSWAPIVDQQIQDLRVVNGGSAVVIAGAQSTLNGTTSHGIGEVDAVTGKTLPFAAATFTDNYGLDSAFTSLSGDNDTVYATAYAFHSGNLEGMLAIDPQGGAVKWVDDCHGDSYSVYATGSVEYLAGHAHDCGNIGGFPQAGDFADQSTWTHYRGIAFSKAATGKVGSLFPYFTGSPAPSLLDWFPDLEEGTYTGQSQGPWNVVGNGSYVAYGGEFPSVNGAAQQGLVRFALPSIAPNKVGPDSGTGLVPTARSSSSGTVQLSWQATSDQDNQTLRYDVYRSDQAQPVGSVTAASTFWDLPTLSFTDTTAPAGQVVSYYVRAVDPFGNGVSGASASVTVSSTVVGGTAPDNYSRAVLADGPQNYWRLGEASGSKSLDQAGTSDLTLGSGVSLGKPGALSNRPNTAAAFNGTSTGTSSSGTAISGPNTFSLEAWFKTTSTAGGKVIGFGDRNSGASGSFDRQVNLDGSGRVSFGVFNNAMSSVQSAAGFNDGKWHHAVATLGSAGMALYLDGTLVGSKADATFGANYTGYWRVGGDSSWNGAQPWLNATIDEVAVYPVALSAGQIAAHYAAGLNSGPNNPPTAAFTSTVSNLVVALDGSGSSDTDGTVASYAWDFGDGQTGTGKTVSHTYATAGPYTVKLTVTDNAGATGTVSKSVTTTAPPPNAPPTAAFTSTVNGLVVALDGSGSSDTDGTVASYAWDFGDGQTGTGKTVSHSYGAAGSYTVKLTVTDNAGATGTVSKPVTVTAPPAGAAIASDAFGRTVTGGWGSADTGGAWTVVGTAANASVAGGTGSLAAAKGAGIYADLGISAQDVAMQADVSLTKAASGGGTYVNLAGRNVGGNQYNAQLWFASGGTVWLSLLKVNGGAETDLGDFQLPGTYTVGQSITVRLDLSGSGTTTLHGKAWVTGTAQPATWQLNATDTTAALQKAGGLEFQLYNSSTATATQTVKVDNLWAGAAGTVPGGVTPPANSAPTAAFTSTVSNLTVAVDGSTSSDADGTVASYAWDFGDGSTGTGKTATHTYAAAGPYTVKLTVTDNAGATGTVSKSVTVTAPPAGTALASDAFGRTVTGGWGSADLGGPWTIIGTAANAAVAGGTGSLTAAKGAGIYADLGVSAQDVAVQADVSLTKAASGGGTFVNLAGRNVGGNQYNTQLWFASDGTMWLSLLKEANGVETDLGDYQLAGTYTVGQSVTVRLDLSGSGTTTLHAKAWITGTTEPAAWQLNATDSEATLQKAGGLEVQLYTSSSATATQTIKVDNLWAGAAGAKP